MKNLITSLYAIAHVFNPFFTGSLTDGKEYAVFKIFKKNDTLRIVVINDSGKLEEWGANNFSFIQK